MSNHDDEDSETRRLLERQARLARLAELNVPIGERFEDQEPVADIGVNPFREGQDVQFELPEDRPLRAAAAARNRVPSAAVAALAPHVADMSATCRRHVQMSPISGRHCMSIRHGEGSDICFL